MSPATGITSECEPPSGCWELFHPLGHLPSPAPLRYLFIFILGICVFACMYVSASCIEIAIYFSVGMIISSSLI